MKAEETIDFPIRWAWHKISRLYNLEANRQNFTMSMGYALLNIDRKKGTPSTKLGPLMGMESRSLTRTLKTMEEKGFITRIPDEIDKRSVRIHLTDLGAEVREISKLTVINLNNKLKERLSEEELNTFFQVIGKINDTLDRTSQLTEMNQLNKRIETLKQ